MTVIIFSRMIEAFMLQQVAPHPSGLRIAIRIILGLFVAVLFCYIVIEQVGSWRRRRSDRDSEQP